MEHIIEFINENFDVDITKPPIAPPNVAKVNDKETKKSREIGILYDLYSKKFNEKLKKINR